MVLDTSVLLQILFHETGAEEAVATIGQASRPLLAAPSLLETEIVYGARQGFGLADVAELVSRLGLIVRPFTAEHSLEAKVAYARYGKGQKHPAQLNFGDCVSYALAKVEGKPLAYKGNDFDATDLELIKLG